MCDLLLCVDEGDDVLARAKVLVQVGVSQFNFQISEAYFHWGDFEIRLGIFWIIGSPLSNHFAVVNASYVSVVIVESCIDVKESRFVLILRIRI